LRVAPPSVLADAGASHAIVPIRNRRDSDMLLGDEQIGTEFLHLVRVGLRRPDDPLIMGSLRLAHALLKTDTPGRRAWRRYRGQRPVAQYAFWWPHAAIASMPAGARLAIALPESAIVHWGRDGWMGIEDTPTIDSGLGFHVAVLSTVGLAPGSWINFTWRDLEAGEWSGCDERVEVMAAEQPVASFTTLQPGAGAARSFRG